MNFADRLLAAVEARRNPAVVGLDSDFARLPGFLKEEHRGRHADPFAAAAACLAEFNRRVIDAVADVVPAVKIQIAFYEQLGLPGLEAFQRTIGMARAAGLIVIGDAKRNDIGNTAAAYSRAFLGRVELYGEERPVFDVDAVTLNGYFGVDGIRPFLEDAGRYGKGLFILVKTSNPGSGELQDLVLSGAAGPEGTEGKKVSEVMAELTAGWGLPLVGRRGYSSVGAVVGATWPLEAERLRALMPNSWFLVPGYGAQGGTADDILPCFNRDGFGAVVNSSRDVLFAWQKSGRPEREFDRAARDAALAMKDALRDSLVHAGIYPW